MPTTPRQRLAIFLRKNHTPNHFRNVLLGWLGQPQTTRSIICSGFFQENNAYKAAKDFDFTATAHNQSLKIQFVGVYPSWSSEFRDFVKSVRKVNSAILSITIDGRRISKLPWHAKVAICYLNGRPRAAIIGSSNITSRAFGMNSTFNCEADVMLWYKDDQEYDGVINSHLEIIDDPLEVIISAYNPHFPGRINRRISIERRLELLAQEIMNLRAKETI